MSCAPGKSFNYSVVAAICQLHVWDTRIVTATMSSGENEMVVYAFLHRVPRSIFAQEENRERKGEGKKKEIIYSCTCHFI